MIPIPLTTVVYDRGAAGAFTWQNPISLAGRLTSYEDAIEARGGFVSLRVAFRCTPAELKEWLDAGLLRGMRSYTPRGRMRWEGVLIELKATIGPIVITRSLENMANVLLVSYGTDQGSTANTATFSSAASIAEYGTKMLQADLSTTTAAGAANWAETELVKAAWPQRAREITLDDDVGGDITVELRAVGRYILLDWLLTANTSTTTAATNTQLIALLTAYNAINNWFSTSAADIIATGHSDTEYIDPYTSYQEKIETLLSQGNSSRQALAWGVYEGGAFVVKVWAGATPSVISYYRDARDKTVRDPYGNVVDPWDVLPDAMAEDVAILGMAEDAAAIATETREYIARVGLRIGAGGVQLTMEPDVLSTTSPAAVAEAIQHPIGRGATDRSSRASAVGRAIKKKTRTIHQSADNPETPTITGGGSIDTGGGTITYPPGSGSSTGVTGSGTTGVLTKWSNGGAGVLTNAVAGTDYVAPGSLSESIDDRVAALLVAGSGIGLSYNDAGGALTITNTAGGTVGGSGTAGRIPQWATGGADLENSTLAKTGAGVLTLSAAGAATLTIDASIRLTGSGASSGDALIYNGTAFAPTTLTPAAIGAIDGSGTAGRLAQWSDADTLAAATLIKSGAGVLTLSAAGAYTLTIPATGTAALGSGTANQIAYWTDAFTLASDTDLRFDGTRASLGTALSAVSRLIVRGTGTGSGTYAIYAENSGGTVAGYMRDDGTVYGRTLIATDGEFSSAAGNHWDFGTYIAGAPTATGYIQIIIDGVSRKLLAA